MLGLQDVVLIELPSNKDSLNIFEENMEKTSEKVRKAPVAENDLQIVRILIKSLKSFKIISILPV